jgi:enoyl-CoA hydratase/carnithine racemase
VVSAVNGHAMGGGAGLAIAADLAVMAEGAKLGYPEPKHGIVAAIVMANLVRQVGRKAAFELVALGEPIGAERAFQLGMVNRVVPDAELISHCISLGEKLASVSRPAMAQTKRLFHEVADLPLAAALERGRDTNQRMRNFEKLAK